MVLKEEKEMINQETIDLELVKTVKKKIIKIDLKEKEKRDPKEKKLPSIPSFLPSPLNKKESLNPKKKTSLIN
jgi:hypothetical protein